MLRGNIEKLYIQCIFSYEKNSHCFFNIVLLVLTHQGSLNVSGMGKDLEQAISHFAKT